jgi:hypothetical protein
MVLQWCHNVVKMVLQWCYNGVVVRDMLCDAFLMQCDIIRDAVFRCNVNSLTLCDSSILSTVIILCKNERGTYVSNHDIVDNNTCGKHTQIMEVINPVHDVACSRTIYAKFC